MQKRERKRERYPSPLTSSLKDWNFEEQKMARGSKFRGRIKKDLENPKLQGH